MTTGNERRKSKDWLPRSRRGRIEMARKWLEVLDDHAAEWGIPNGEVVTLRQIHAAAVQTNTAAEDGQGNRVLIAQANEVSRALGNQMRRLHRRFLSLDFVDSDWISLDLDPRDNSRTTHFEVKELVRASLRPGAIREVIIDFQIEGADHKAKPEGYDGAVVMWVVGGAPAMDLAELIGGHEMASRTPYSLHFTDADRGKVVSVALCWQNERGIRGQWTEILSTVIP